VQAAERAIPNFGARSCTGTEIGEAMTAEALYPLESETLELPFNDVFVDVENGIVNIEAIVDDTMAPTPNGRSAASTTIPAPAPASASSRGEAPRHPARRLSIQRVHHPPRAPPRVTP